MTKVILAGKTQHGKNRINENGEVWSVHDHKSPLQGGKILIKSEQTDNMCWIRADGTDENFEIVEFVDLTKDW